MKIIRFTFPGLLILLLASSGCGKEKTFDIRGDWSFRSGNEEIYAISFFGSSESGTLVETHTNYGQGTYTVSGKEVVFELLPTLDNVGGGGGRFRGTFITGDTISGTMDLFWPYPPFEKSVEVEGGKL